MLRPRALLGCAAVSVVGGGQEVEQTPGVSLWAGMTGPVTPFHLTVVETPDGQTVTGWPDEIDDDPSALLLLPDPFSFPADSFLQRLAQDRPGLPVVGGMASAARGPGGNRLVIDDRVVTDGAVGVFLPSSLTVTTVVSQGCRPLGTPYAVTRAEDNVVFELGGKPALERLQEVAAGATESDRRLLAQFIHIGRVIDERKVDFDRGDFLIRNVLGADPRAGAIMVNDLVEVGSTLQFQVRDAVSAGEDLVQLMGSRDVGRGPAVHLQRAGLAPVPHARATTRRWCPTAWAASPWRACSAPASSAPSAAATSSTASPPRSSSPVSGPS